MELIVCEGREELTQAASTWCRDSVHRLDAKTLYIPAGQTPITLYEAWEAEKPDYLKAMRLMQIDDVLTGSQKGIFRQFFVRYLPSYQTQVQFIDQADQVADLAILGLGLNGHVAFHEPGLPRDFFSGCVLLSDRTRETLKLEEPTWGISYGLGAFLETKAILMIVKGQSKREVLARLLKRDPSLPASVLLEHPAFTILADCEAHP